jgi:hypothetical protein
VIKVTIEIIPFGNENQRRKLGEINIINDATGTPDVGNYRIYYWKPDTGTLVTKVKNYKREDGYLKLLQKCINKLVKHEK